MDKSLSDRAYDALLESILSGSLRPSTPVDIGAFAARLNMSVTPVRMALKQLESDGLVEILPRRGTFVKHLTIRNLITSYELVEGLEGMAGYLTAERVKEGLLGAREVEAVLAPYIVEMEAHLEPSSMRIWAHLDMEFHQTICDLCGNELISSAFRSIKNQMQSVLTLVSPIYVDRENSMREHRAILESILSGDEEGARQICQSHRHLVRGILINLSRQLEPGNAHSGGLSGFDEARPSLGRAGGGM